MLIDLDQQAHGGPYEGSSAVDFVETMTKARDRLMDLTGLNIHGGMN